MATEILTTFQLKRGTAARWLEVNPILSQGEPGYEYDTHLLKIGDGIKTWIDLPYIGIQEIPEDDDNISYTFSGSEEETNVFFTVKASNIEEAISIYLDTYTKKEIEETYLNKQEAQNTYQPKGEYITAQIITWEADD